jgi:hypothetical protein
MSSPILLSSAISLLWIGLMWRSASSRPSRNRNRTSSRAPISPGDAVDERADQRFTVAIGAEIHRMHRAAGCPKLRRRINDGIGLAKARLAKQDQAWIVDQLVQLRSIRWAKADGRRLAEKRLLDVRAGGRPIPSPGIASWACA